MARLKFQCQDRDGNLVEFETSEHEGKELMATYPQYVKWLTDNGFTLLKAKQGGAKPKVKFDGVHCAKCGHEVWDNRSKKAEDPSKAKWPDFSCKDKACKWAVWPGQWEIGT